MPSTNVQQKAMKVTLEDIEAKKTANGGWTKKTLAEWGVPWPPPKGWKQALIEGRAVLSARDSPKAIEVK